MKTAGRDSGMTLVEVVVFLAIFSVTLLAATQTFQATSASQGEVGLRDLMEERLRRAAERLVNHLHAAGTATLEEVPEAPSTSSSVRFRRLVSYDVRWGAAWGPEERIYHAVRKTETLNGQDDDKDGLPDNGALIWESEGRRVLWCPDLIDASFSRRDGQLLIRLRCGTVGPKGELIRISRTTNVKLNN